MCHGHSAWSLEFGREATEDDADEQEREESDWSPEFLNEEGETETELLTDGGDDS